MKEILNFDISEFHVITIAVLGLVLFLVLKMIRKILIPKTSFTKFQQYYFLVEIIIWLIFLIWIFKTFFRESVFYSIGLVSIFAIIFLGLAWFVGKDFIAGIVFKLNDSYKIGQLLILSENIKGYIEKINYLNIDLSSEEGEIIRIPYSKIQGEVYKKSYITKDTKFFRIEIEYPKLKSLNETKYYLKKQILLSPGVNLEIDPQIILKQEFENYWIFEISFNLLNENYLDLVKSNMERVKAFNEN